MALEIKRAEGSKLFDHSGKEYIDLIGGISVANIGHRHPNIIKAIQDQLEDYLHIMVYGEFIQTPQVQYSHLLAAHLLQQKAIPLNHPHVHFSQLYGMSDNITFNLAKAGCSVSKYLPFGPIKDVVPYLMRRAQKNTSVGGQTSRELNLIEKEIKRREAIKGKS